MEQDIWATPRRQQRKTVVAYDASTEMLDTVRAEAARRELKNISVVLGRAEELPFDTASFDWVCTRYSAHHWTNIQDAFREIKRVVKPDGTIIVMDIYAPATALLDMHLQTIELLRDGSHVRDYALSEWHALLSGNGWEGFETYAFKVEIDFESWVKRMKTPPLFVEAIFTFLRQAGVFPSF